MHRFAQRKSISPQAAMHAPALSLLRSADVFRRSSTGKGTLRSHAPSIRGKAIRLTCSRVLLLSHNAAWGASCSRKISAPHKAMAPPMMMSPGSAVAKSANHGLKSRGIVRKETGKSFQSAPGGYGCETGAMLGFARSAATCTACIRNAANAARHTPYAARTPKASEASVAHTSISIFIAFCIPKNSPIASQPAHSAWTEQGHVPLRCQRLQKWQVVDPIFCCRIRYRKDLVPI